MCFWKSEESKVLVAKRDITVYKLGCFASSNFFHPIYITAYCYYKNKIVKEDIYFDDDVLYKGFHSYINCIVKSSERLFHLFVRITSRNKYLDDIIYPRKDMAFLGKFIIPKGTTYCINMENEVISNSIVYTGHYIKLEGTMNFNVKDIWKEK